MGSNLSHVALFWTRLQGGGAERIMLTLAEEFLDRGIETDIVLVRKEGELVEDIPSEARVFDLQAPRILASLPELVRYLQRRQPPVLLSALSTNYIALWARALSRVSTRVVISEHSALSGSNSQRSFQEWGLTQLARFTYPFADGVIAVSEGVAESISTSIGLRKEKIDVVYNPVVGPKMSKKGEENIDHPWFSQKNCPVVIGVGRLIEEKDFSNLIRAFSVVSKEKEASKLVILGEGKERSRLEALAHSLGVSDQLWMPGFVSSPLKYMARASVFALSSRSEGLPTVLIEAIASGAPVVATDCPSGPREILEGGKYGRLVPTEDASALATAIAEALDGEIEPAPTSALDRFRRDKVAERYLDILS